MPRARDRNRDSPGSLAWADQSGAALAPMARISNGVAKRAVPLDLKCRTNMGNGDLDLGIFRLNGSGQRKSLLFFTMDEKNLIWSRVDGPHVGQEILAIRMGREPVELDDLRPARSGYAENRHDIPPFDQFASEGMLGLKAHEDDHVRFVLNRMFEMMHDAAAFAHAGGGNDDTGTLHAVQTLAVLR